VKLTPSRRLYAFGATLLIALTICSRKLSSMGEPSFIIPLAVAGIAYLVAIREFFSTPRFPHRVIVIGLVFAALWHLPFLLMLPGSDDDVHRYIWDGRVQRLGYNPYIVVPSDPALGGLHTPETRTLNNPDVPSPYPAGAQLFFRAITAIHESIWFAIWQLFSFCSMSYVLVSKGRTGFWPMPGTHSWRRKSLAAATSILLACCSCWYPSRRWGAVGVRLQPWHLGWLLQ
jgi:hypothetical protein